MRNDIRHFLKILLLRARFKASIFTGGIRSRGKLKKASLRCRSFLSSKISGHVVKKGSNLYLYGCLQWVQVCKYEHGCSNARISRFLPSGESKQSGCWNGSTRWYFFWYLKGLLRNMLAKLQALDLPVSRSSRRLWEIIFRLMLCNGLTLRGDMPFQKLSMLYLQQILKVSCTNPLLKLRKLSFL